ncbi:VOC family protein [Paraburkholderia sediminicola]|uniref:VOC family protein n=1 Tax=Paraburkholderia sediminicola TaxID=458836 RepID=UPI0038BA062F
MTQITVGRISNPSVSTVPLRLHHNAYVCRDLEETRRFYEDVLGWPLVAVWRAHDIVFGEDIEYCHNFYRFVDGSLLAFFVFDKPSLQQRFSEFGPHSPFVHLALQIDQERQNEVETRLREAGLKTQRIDHGYCQSLYVTDPNGLNHEFTVDHPDWPQIEAACAATAHDDLRRWLGGDRTTNNEWRSQV